MDLSLKRTRCNIKTNSSRQTDPFTVKTSSSCKTDPFCHQNGSVLVTTSSLPYCRPVIGQVRNKFQTDQSIQLVRNMSKTGMSLQQISFVYVDQLLKPK